MEPYYITIFIFLIVGFIISITDDNVKKVVYVIAVLLCSIFFGSRYKVGVDWKNYIEAFYNYNVSPNSFSLEIGYKLLNVIAHKLGYDIQFVIYVTTFIVFGVSFYGLCKLKINSFYYLAITFPYFIVMGALNYTRQGVALSLFILSVYFILNQKKFLFFVSIFIGCVFHISLIVFLLLLFIRFKQRYLSIIIIPILPLFFILVNYQYSMYLDADFDSKGLLLRLAFILLSSFLLSLNIRNIKMMEIGYKRFFIISILSPFIILIISIISTTMADRISYYFILMSTICSFILIGGDSKVLFKKSIPILLFLCSFIVFIVWSIYSSYIPYYIFRSLIFDGVF